MADNKDKKLTLEIAPGAFDDFDGTQEELDELISEIERMVEDKSIFENSEPLDLEALFQEDPEQALKIANSLGLFEGLVDEFGNEIDFDEIQESITPERKHRLN